MSRFIAVVHGWHVSSNGFNVHELESTTYDEADKEAALINHRRSSTFDKCDYDLIEFGNDEIILPRKLTWKERLTGVLR